MSPEPRYERIARNLRDAIQSGELAPGAQVPTERELQEQYGVSVTVARAAVNQLRAQGLITSQQGKGSFVREQKPMLRMGEGRYLRRAAVAPHRREALAGGWTDDFETQLHQVRAAPAVAARLHIETGEMVSEAIYRRLVNGEPVQVSAQWEPLSITGGTSAESPSDGSLGSPDVVTRFERIGIRITHVSEIIGARMPTPAEVQELEMDLGTPVITIERTHWASEIPVETADIVLRADRHAINNRQEVQDAED